MPVRGGIASGGRGYHRIYLAKQKRGREEKRIKVIESEKRIRNKPGEAPGPLKRKGGMRFGHVAHPHHSSAVGKTRSLITNDYN